MIDMDSHKSVVLISEQLAGREGRFIANGGFSLITLRRPMHDRCVILIKVSGSYTRASKQKVSFVRMF